MTDLDDLILLSEQQRQESQRPWPFISSNISNGITSKQLSYIDRELDNIQTGETSANQKLSEARRKLKEIENTGSLKNIPIAAGGVETAIQILEKEKFDTMNSLQAIGEVSFPSTNEQLDQLDTFFRETDAILNDLLSDERQLKDALAQGYSVLSPTPTQFQEELKSRLLQLCKVYPEHAPFWAKTLHSDTYVRYNPVQKPKIKQEYIVESQLSLKVINNDTNNNSDSPASISDLKQWSELRVQTLKSLKFAASANMKIETTRLEAVRLFVRSLMKGNPNISADTAYGTATTIEHSIFLANQSDYSLLVNKASKICCDCLPF